MVGERESALGDLARRAQDAVGGLVGKASAAVGGHSETMFAQQARIADLYEIEAAEVALSRSSSEAVRSFAETIVNDHRNSVQQMEKAIIGREEKLSLANELDSRRRSMVNNLKAVTDDEFDRTYINQQRAAHDEAMTLFETFAKSHQQTVLGAFAAGAIPVLQQHAELLDGAQSAAGT